MNPSKEDVGVLNAYEFDLAFGSDENNFEITISEHVLDYGYYLYFEGTEYGGVIDSIHVETSSDVIVYSGRTWHGIMEKKVIAPDDGMDYLTVNGNANAVLADLITRLDLDGFFEASEEESDVVIENYSFPRYVPGYEGIRKMLTQFYGKLKIEFLSGHVVLSAIPRIDYSKDEEFDSSQVQFKITKNQNPLNHLVCLGSGELSKRHVIHLFADANGGIQPYATKEQPIEDADYILDTTKQVLFEDDEYAEIYDYSSASTTINYVLLSENDKPEDWDRVFNQYYARDEEDRYSQLESWEEEVYSDLLTQPLDWNTNFKDYFTTNQDSEYVPVAEVNQTVYDLQSAAPANWNSRFFDYYRKNGSNYDPVESVIAVNYKMLDVEPNGWKEGYNNFYYYYSDGVTEEYRKVPSDSKTQYNLQSMQPSDWETNFGNYYQKKASGSGFERVTAIGEDNPKYKMQKKSPSDWKKNYASYYYLYSDGTITEYRKVSGVSKAKYVLQTQKPSDWSTNASAYFTKNKNGVYVAVDGKPKMTYELVNSQPANWATNYTDYYSKSRDGKSYVAVAQQSGVPAFKTNTYYEGTEITTAPTWKKSMYYTRTTYNVAPSWEEKTYYTKENPQVPKWAKNTYYTASTISVAPAFEKDKYYACVTQEVAPIWISGTFYTQRIVTVPSFVVGTYYKKTMEIMWPEWKADTYYRAAEDNYADLVANAIERLEEAIDCDELEIDFNSDDFIFDIGDIVGASDSITGLALWQPITKKIVNIKNDITTISYKVGE